MQKVVAVGICTAVDEHWRAYKKPIKAGLFGAAGGPTVVVLPPALVSDRSKHPIRRHERRE
jgi:hypothetical protein